MLWVTVERATREGRACRLLRLAGADGEPRAEGVAFPWRRDLVVTPRAAGQAAFRIRRRRSFPLTGTFDVLALDASRRLGTCHRDGRVRDAAGRVLGRFRSAERLGQQIRAGALEALAAIASGLADQADTGRMPQAWVWMVDDRPAGSLARRAPPAPVPPPGAALPPALARWIPGALRRAWARRADPRAWAFESDVAWPGDPLLRDASVLCFVELSHW